MIIFDVLSSLAIFELGHDKPVVCLCKNKGTDQLLSNCEADQHLGFHYTDSTLPLFLKYEISSVYPSSAATQTCLCQTWSETPKMEQHLLGRNHYCRELIRLAQGHNMVPHEGIEPQTSRFRGRCPPGHHSFISWRINVSCSRTQLKPVLPNCGCL